MVPFQVAGLHPVNGRGRGLDDHQSARRIIADLSSTSPLSTAVEEGPRPDDDHIARMSAPVIAEAAWADENRGPEGVKLTIVWAVPRLIELDLLEEVLLGDDRKDGDSPAQENLFEQIKLDE